MIEAVDLTKRYPDGTLALDTLSFKVEPGEIFCLLGAYGAGKTTALHLFLGFTRPTSGRALLDGIEVAREPLEARRRLAYLMEDVALYPGLTAFGNLELFARLAERGELGEDDYAMAMREVGLPERSFTEKVGSFSKGMRQKLGLAAAMIKDAPALLLDEPMGGLDPKDAAEIAEVLERLRDRGRAILLSTHDLFRARQLADRLAVLKEGRRVLTCTREEMRYQSLEALYLDYMRGRLSPRQELERESDG